MTYNALAPQPLSALGTRRRSHYSIKTKYNDNRESPLRGRSRHCYTHVQNRYFECPSSSYHEMETGYRNHRSMSNSSGSHEPNKKKTKRGSIHEDTQENDYNLHQLRGSSLFKWVLNNWLLKNCISIKMSLDNYDGLIDPREHV